jgi:ABC-2 type transport system permease protein
MPGWLTAVAHFNPLTYEVDALRALMIQGGVTAYGVGVDFAVLLFASTMLTTISTRLYPHLAR